MITVHSLPVVKPVILSCPCVHLFPCFPLEGHTDYGNYNNLRWISTHFGRTGLENYVPELAILLSLEPIKLGTLK